MKTLWSRAKAPICNRKGFTFVEALIVTAIVGMLGAIIIPQVLGARAKKNFEASPQGRFIACASDMFEPLGEKTLTVNLGRSAKFMEVTTYKETAGIAGNIHNLVGKNVNTCDDQGCKTSRIELVPVSGEALSQDDATYTARLNVCWERYMKTAQPQ